MQLESRAEAARAERRANVSMRIEMATLEQCLERGIDGVTVEEVAAAACISRRTFYRYFETINDVLCAMPRRSLQRFAADFRSRPLSEGVIKACGQVFRHTQISDEERAIHHLAVNVAQTSTEAWWRAMNSMRPSANDFYEQLIAERLTARGEDAGPAGLIAAVLTGVIGYVTQRGISEGIFPPDPRSVEKALLSLGPIISDA